MGLYAHFDEAGHPEDKATHSLLMAGCVAESGDWLAFAEDWSRILASEGIIWFHWKEWKHGHGQFEGWGRDRRERLMSRLVATIQGSVKAIIGFSRIYTWAESQSKGNLRDEYLMLHRHAITNTMNALSGWGVLNDRVHFVFARHPEVNPTEHFGHLRIAFDSPDPYYHGEDHAARVRRPPPGEHEREPDERQRDRRRAGSSARA